MQLKSSAALPQSIHRAPLGGVLLRVGSVVFIVESLIMLAFLLVNPDGHRWQDAFLDASVLTVVVAVVVHRWIIQPLDTQLALTIAELNDAKSVAERLAQTDPLTGVLNRRAFFERLEREFLKAERSQRPLSLLMLDIDFFKKLNDTHGHLAGDAVLRNIAQVMQSACRAYDDVSRFGGEEFCILLADTPLIDAVEFAERLRVILAETVITHGEQRLFVTVSIGVAQQGPRTPDMTTLIECADQALFEAKRTGRNRVQPTMNRNGELENWWQCVTIQEAFAERSPSACTKRNASPSVISR